MKENKTKRRRFLELSGLAAGGLAILGGFKLFKDDIFNQKIAPSKVLSQSVANGDIKIQPQKTNVFISASQQDHDAVYYQIDGDVIKIYAILDCRKNPKRTIEELKQRRT